MQIKLKNGLPTKHNNTKAAHGYFLMAQSSDATNSIQRIHDKLKAQNIWIWKQGTIETPLGLNGKGNAHWFDFSRRLEHENYKTVLPHWQEVEKLVHWITE